MWRPIFKGEALLPGDYLSQMVPWNSLYENAPQPQWNPLQWDAIAQFYPWRVFYARSMSSGHIPLWNPHQFSGTPFLANGQSAVLYPPNLLFLIFSPITAFTVFAALHLFLAASFTYKLLRELGCRELGGIVGGICFAFCAFMVLWLELPTFIGVAVWLPLILFLIHRSVERRSNFYAMLAGGALALSFLAGHFQIALYVAMAASLWWLWRLIETWCAEGKLYALVRVVAPFVAFAVIAGLIAAAQVLPSLELAGNSHRVSTPSAEGYSWFIANSLKPYRLITAFLPDYFGNPSKNSYFLLGNLDGHAGSAADYMEYGMYVGMLPLMLAAIGVTLFRKKRHVGFFVALSLLAFLSAIGTPINAPFYYLVPGFSAFGGPNRILVLYLFGVACLAGFGIDRFVESANEKVVNWRQKEVSASQPLFLWAILACLLGLGIASCLVAVPGMIARVISRGASHETLVPSAMLFISFVLILVYVTGSVSRKLFSILAVTVIVADLFAFGINYNPTCARAKVYPRTKLTDTLKRITGDSRIAPINPSWSLFETPKAILPPNAAMVYGLYDVQGYDSLYTRQYKDRSSAAQGVDSSPPENGNLVLIRRFTSDRLRATLGAIYALTGRDSDAQGVHLDKTSKIAETDGVTIYNLLPPRVRPRIAMTRYWEPPNTWAISDRAGIDMFYTPPIHFEQGWIASIDGKALRIEQHKGRLFARAKGPGRITFSYQPFSFRFGLFLALLGLSSLSLVGMYRTMKYNHYKR